MAACCRHTRSLLIWRLIQTLRFAMLVKADRAGWWPQKPAILKLEMPTSMSPVLVDFTRGPPESPGQMSCLEFVVAGVEGQGDGVQRGVGEAASKIDSVRFGTGRDGTAASPEQTLRGSEGLRLAPLRMTPPHPAHMLVEGTLMPMTDLYMEVHLAADT